MKLDKSFNQIEVQELIQKLIDNGQRDLVDAFLSYYELTFTKKARLNKSAACRVLKWKTKQLEEALEKCKEILQQDFID